MAIGTPTSIGTIGDEITSATTTLTTTATVNAGEHVVIAWYSSGNRTPSSVNGTNGLTWQQDAGLATANGSTWIYSAYAPDGLASGVTIVVNFASELADRNLAAYSISGLSSTVWKDQTATLSIATGTNTIDTGTTSPRTSAEQVSFGAVGENGNTATTATITGPALELNEVTNAGNRIMVTAYDQHTDTGTSRIQGTLTTTLGARVGAIVTYKSTVGVWPAFNAIPFMGGH